MSNKPQMGNTLAEYSVIIGLVVAASIASVSLLGDSASGLFGKTDQKLSNGGAKQLVALQFGNGVANAAGSGSAISGSSSAIAVTGTATSPGNGLISVSEGNSSGTNATAAEGATNRVDAAYQNISYAMQMESRLSTSMEPSLYEWASRIARYSRLSAGAAGVLNDLNAFQNTPNATTFGANQQVHPDSLHNTLIDYQASLKSLISNPPPGANAGDVKFFSTLGSNVANNINQETAGSTTKRQAANEGNTLVVNDFGQYMSDEQLSRAIHQAAQSGEAQNVSAGLGSMMNSSDTLNSTTPD